MTAPRVDNRTDFIAHPQVLVDKDGEKLVMMVKSTWELPRGGDTLELAPEDRQRGIRPADLPWGDPEKSSIAFPGDFCVRKPGTDVVVVAAGHAPGSREVGQFDCGVRVGPLERALRVSGTRVFAPGGRISDPLPLSELELRWEYAYGGADFDLEGNGVEEPRNPLGRGVARDPATLVHQPAPQIEDPFEPMQAAGQRPAPAGVGAIGRHWEPRRRHLGSYDAKWLDNRAPLTPADEDDRIHCCAAPGLHADRPLLGGEEVALTNLSEGGGTIRFRLPRLRVAISFDVEGRKRELFAPPIDTIVIDQLFGHKKGLPTVELSWRAAVKAPRNLKTTRIRLREVDA